MVFDAICSCSLTFGPSEQRLKLEPNHVCRRPSPQDISTGNQSRRKAAGRGGHDAHQPALLEMIRKLPECRRLNPEASASVLPSPQSIMGQLFSLVLTPVGPEAS